MKWGSLVHASSMVAYSVHSHTLHGYFYTSSWPGKKYLNVVFLIFLVRNALGSDQSS